MTTAGLSAVTEVCLTDVNVLHEADEALEPHEIAVAINTKRNNIDQLLYKMAKAGEVLKAQRGRYIHPSRTDLIALDASTPHKNDKKIRDEDET